MPTALLEHALRFFFYSNENDEPMRGFTAKEERQIMEIVFAKIEILKQKWNEHFA